MSYELLKDVTGVVLNSFERDKISFLALPHSQIAAILEDCHAAMQVIVDYFSNEVATQETGAHEGALLKLKLYGAVIVADPYLKLIVDPLGKFCKQAEALFQDDGRSSGAPDPNADLRAQSRRGSVAQLRQYAEFVKQLASISRVCAGRRDTA